jgi:hypothetical protein
VLESQGFCGQFVSVPILVAALVMLMWILDLGCGSSSSCGEGFEQQGTSCVPELFDCAEPCGPHETCKQGNDGEVCECVVGYEGDPCVWSGAPADPDFTDQAAWPNKTNGATIIPLTVGERTGIASFESSVACNAGAVSQTIEMPSYASAEPFVGEVTYRATVTAVDVGYGRTQETLPGTGGDWRTRRFCFGEAAYGGSVKFQLASSERLADCFSAPSGTIEVDRFEILVAHEDECPAPGSVLNGGANVEEGGWFLFAEGFNGEEAAIAALEPKVGKDGSSGARIYKAAGSSNRATMGTQVSVPLPTTLPAPALRFWWRGTKGATFRSELGTFLGLNSVLTGLDYFVGTGEPETYTYCLAPWTHGSVVDLAFTAVEEGDFVANESELVVDDVRVISDPRCGDSTDVLDPSFDSAPNRWPAVIQLGTAGNSVRVLNDSKRARPPGSGVLEISYASSESYIGVGTRVWVPRSEQNRGPQLVFYSNVPADPQVPVQWLLGLSGTINAELEPGGGWRPNEVCLPPEWAERWFRFGVRVNRSTEPPQTFDPPKQVLLDDFQLTTSEACPVQTP